MEEEQYKRYRKMISENLKCLYKTSDSKNNFYFLTSGSSKNNYKVKISTNGSITCTCADFVKGGSKINNCICKHCLHIIFIELKLFKDVNHTFFKRCFFTPDEMKNIKDILKGHAVP